MLGMERARSGPDKVDRQEKQPAINCNRPEASDLLVPDTSVPFGRTKTPVVDRLRRNMMRVNHGTVEGAARDGKEAGSAAGHLWRHWVDPFLPLEEPSFVNSIREMAF